MFFYFIIVLFFSNDRLAFLFIRLNILAVWPLRLNILAMYISDLL